MPASSRPNPRTAVLLVGPDATSRRLVRAELEATGNRVEEPGRTLLRLDLAARRVFVTGTEIFLSRTEFALLATLCERPHRIRSRAALLADVWGQELQATPRFVDAYVSRLKLKLGPAGWCIRAVRGVGYRVDPLGQF